MSAPVLPFIPAAVRALLVNDDRWTALVTPARTLTRAPANVTTPFALVKAPPAVPLDVSGGAWAPLVQVEFYCPPTGVEDPETVAWRGAATAAAILSRTRNATYQTMRYKARVIDGPLTDVDTSRGDSTPLYRAFIRAELTVHAH